MNVYQNHLSYIKNIKMYSKQYICALCDKPLSQTQKLKQHQSKRDGTVKYVFLVTCTKINCLCFMLNWRKWVYGCVKQTNMKSSLRAMILRRIGMILMKRWMLIKKILWR